MTDPDDPTYTITIDIVNLGRAKTINWYRNQHWAKLAETTRQWRLVAKTLWRKAAANHPIPLTECVATITPLQRNHHGLADVGAHFPSAKAAIDGAIDAKVLLDDTHIHVKKIVFKRTSICANDGLTITLRGRPVR